MAKLFKLALESSDLEGAVAPESTQPALDEAELEQNVEETTQEQAEIEQGGEEIDQALEEAEGLVEQIEANDEKLENPDAVVTAADVEVSEEALKRACYSLGIPFQAKLSFASESIANDIRANARKYLATSNEELKDTFKRIVEAIKKMINSVALKIRQWAASVVLKFGNYTKSIQKISERLDAINNKELTREQVSELAKDLLAKKQAEINYMVINNTFDDGVFIRITKGLSLAESVVKDVQDFSLLSKGLLDEEKLKQYGVKLPKNVDVEDIAPVLLGITGRSALICNPTNAGVKDKDGKIVRSPVFLKVDLENDTESINTANLDFKKLVSEFHLKKANYKKAIESAKATFKRLETIQKSVLVNLDNNKAFKDNPILGEAVAKATLQGYKSLAVASVPFYMSEYINAIKSFVTGGSILAKALESAKSKETK